MKSSMLGWLLGSCLLVVGQIHAAAPGASAQAQIEPIWDRMQAAANAHDTDRFMAVFLHEPGLVFIANGEVIRGWDALHAQQLKWWRNGTADAVYTEQGKTEFQPLAADLMLTTSRFTSQRTGPDGKPSTGAFTVTYLWKHLAQGWTILYGHESWVR